MTAFLRYVLIGFVIVVAQWLMLDRLQIFGGVADGVLLFTAWIGIRYGRRTGAISGFVLGFAIDALTDSWGLNMILKTLTGFTTGLLSSFAAESQIFTPRFAITGSLAVAIPHNLFRLGLLAMQSGDPSWFGFFSVVVVSSLFTVALALIVALFATR